MRLVRAQSPYLHDDDKSCASLRGGRKAAEVGLSGLNPEAYARTRNHLDGDVTRLSPFVRHGVLSSAEIRDQALAISGSAQRAEKFIQQLAWRDYWQQIYITRPDLIWTDAEAYKTGFTADDYADELPADIAAADTGVACIDQFLRELLDTGWMHNHARLYVAGYVCHWRRVKWQAGAAFFLTHLLDGDPASNNLSWQWVASTFSHKPYFFNLENVEKFSGDDIDTSFRRNKPLAGTYEALYDRLFPHMEPSR